jgi:hypothetical protein
MGGNPTRSETIVVAGSLAQRRGRGGHAWVFLQYLLGFRRLGWDVLFLDEIQSGIRRDYQRHSAAARKLAETHFDSDVVLGKLLDDLGIHP